MIDPPSQNPQPSESEKSSANEDAIEFDPRTPSRMPSEQPSPEPEPADEEAIPFRGGWDTDRGEEESPTRSDAHLAIEHYEAEDKYAGVDWFEEEPSVGKGDLFSEPAPEPPPQPFEILHERPKVEDLEDSADKVSTPAPGYAPPEHIKAASGAAPARVKTRPPLILRVTWYWMPLLLLFGGSSAVLWTQQGVGYSWDEAYYYEPSLAAAEWIARMLRGEAVFNEQTIDAAWGERWEHPSMQKILAGLSLLYHEVHPGKLDPSVHLEVIRLPSAILFGFTLMLLYLLGRWAWGAVPGLIIAVAYAAMPRVFGHAHFASLETPLVFFTILTVYCFLKGLDSRMWSVLTGISLGLLLATKINGFFLPIPLIIWGHLYARTRYINNLFAMLMLGPLVMLAAWPWLWPDPIVRFLDYLQFHAAHQKTALFFLGQKWGYGNVNAPWFYPLVMTLVTLPVATGLLCLLGIARALRRPHRRPYGSLFLACALMMFLVACAPGTPKYDGVRLFLNVFPFLALLAGAGVVSILRGVERYQRRYTPRSEISVHIFNRRLAFAIGLVVAVEGGFGIYLYHPFYLSYFNSVIGGVRGANEMGFETTYWGEALNQEVIDYLNALPSGSRIKPLALHELNLQHLQAWGRLKGDLQIGGPPPYDYHLLLIRKGFFGRAESHLFRNVIPLQQWRLWGVPLIGVYPGSEVLI